MRSAKLSAEIHFEELIAPGEMQHGYIQHIYAIRLCMYAWLCVWCVHTWAARDAKLREEIVSEELTASGEMQHTSRTLDVPHRESCSTCERAGGGGGVCGGVVVSPNSNMIPGHP